MTYNVFSGTLSPTHFTVPRRMPILLHGTGCNFGEWYFIRRICIRCTIARVSLLWQHSPNVKCETSASACTRSMLGFSYYVAHSMRSIVMSVSVCMSLCLFGRTDLRNDMSMLHEIFCKYYLWLWLGPPLTTMQYIMYFRFCGPRHVSIIGEAKATLIRRDGVYWVIQQGYTGGSLMCTIALFLLDLLNWGYAKSSEQQAYMEP